MPGLATRGHCGRKLRMPCGIRAVCACVRVYVCECVCECAQMCVWMVSVNVPEPEWPLRGQVDACASRCAHACLHVYLGRVHLRVEGGRGRE